jgi:hypothetical protein
MPGPTGFPAAAFRRRQLKTKLVDDRRRVMEPALAGADLGGQP